MSKLSGVYKIVSILKPDRIYIGSSINVQCRWNEHKRMLLKNKHHSFKLQRHYNKYGLSDLVFVIIEPCLPAFCVIREQYYLDNLTHYFNISDLATGCSISKPMSQEARDKISKANKGKKRTDAQKKAQSERCKGLKVSMETRKKQSEVRKGKVHTKEWNENISKGQKGRVQTQETKKKISETRKSRHIPVWNKGIPRDEATKEKIRQKLIGFRCSEETARKISLAHKGRIPWNKGKTYKKRSK